MDSTTPEPKPINVYIPPSISSMQPIKETVSPPLSCRYESQKKRDWNTFLQYLKNHNPPLELEQTTSELVIEFMKHLDQFGKTKTHLSECAYFGHPNPPAPCDCPLKQAWGSLDALMGRLRAAYEESGRNPELNPFGAEAVRAYLKEVRAEQAKARGISYEKKRKRQSATTSTSVAGGVVTSMLSITPVFDDNSGSGSGSGSMSDAGGVVTSVAGISQVVDSHGGGGGCGGGSVVSCSLPGEIVPFVTGITQVVDGSNGSRHSGDDSTSIVGIAQVVERCEDGGYAAVASTTVITPVVDCSNGGGSGRGPISVATEVVTSTGGITQAVDGSSGSNGGCSVSDASGVAVFENIDTRHNQVDARINHADLLHARENANLANEITSEKQKNEKPTPESINTKLLLPCQKLKIGEVTEGSSTIIEHSERSKRNTPSSSEGVSPHPAPSFGEEKVGSVLDCHTCGSHQTINDGSSIVRIEHSEKSTPTSLKPSEGFFHVPAVNFGQENVGSVLDCKAVGNAQTVDDGSSSVTLERSEKSTATTTNPSEGLAHLPAGNFDQENFRSVLNCNTFGSHQTTDEISLSAPSNGEGEKCESLVLFSERSIDGQAPTNSIATSDERQCKRNGTRWRCHEKALPGRLHCEKHQTKRDNYNKLRRKNPERTRSTIDQCSPLIPRQCGRTGTGWRCPRMASLGKLYCDRHQPKRDAYNEKRRKKPKEDGCLALTTDNNKTLAIQSSAEVQDGN